MRLSLVLVFAIVALFMPLASALTVSGETVNGNLTSGNAISASLQVNVLDFPSDNYLLLTTETTSLTWSNAIIVNNSSTSLGNPTGLTVNLTGSQISFPNATSAVLQVSLTGITPSVTVSASKKIIQIQQFDASGTQVG